ncbi:hypothetical protein MTO96_044583 [Rhipicephalus appendiculatus]
MAVQSQRYTLFGFSKELDLRPLHFVGRIPTEIICDGCGFLPYETAFLPCRHVLCKTCYQQCFVNEEYECLLDCIKFPEEDVEWRAFPLNNLLVCKVKCWNQDNGCEAIMSVRDMLGHFYGGCIYHSTHCPKCSASVLCKDVRAHRRSHCRTHAVPKQAEHLEPLKDSVQEAMLFALETTLRERVEEIRICLDRLIRDHTAQCDRLNEESMVQTSDTQPRTTNESGVACVEKHLAVKAEIIDQVSECISDLSIEASKSTAALSEHIKILEGATRRCFEKFERSNDEIRRRFTCADDRLERVSQTVNSLKEILGKAMECATENGVQVSSDMAEIALFGQNTLNITCYEFRVKGLKELKEIAISAGWAAFKKDPVYLCGYRIAPGLYLRKHESSVAVHLLIELHKGVVDEFLQWPYCHDININFMQSSSDRRREFPNRTPRGLESFLRPTESCNRTRYYPTFVRLEDLERDGYAEGNELCVKWELLPPTTE